MDLANGHVSSEEKLLIKISLHRVSIPHIKIPDDGLRQPPNLVQSRHPRFCLEIRHGRPEYARFFDKVFENKTFRIFRVRPMSETS